MKRICLGLTVALAAASMFLATPAAGQQATGNLYGTIRDPQGGVLPGATVDLSGCGTRQQTISDGRGGYHFLNLAPCSYTVRVTLEGFSTVTVEHVEVTLAKNTQSDVAMKLSSVSTSIVVTSETPLVDTRKTEAGVTFSQAELKAIPTGRDPWVLLQQTPGVLVDRVNVGGSESGQQSGFVGKGSAQSTYNVDGVPVSDTGSGNASPIYFDFDSFQEVQVATGGSDLTLESPGVTLNMVTKRGTNDYHGSARWLYTPQQWQSDNTPAEATAEGLGTDRIQFVREWGAEVGGPILKDKLWIWGAANRNDINLFKTGDLDVNGNQVHNDTVLENWNGKLNWQPIDSNSATFFYLRSDKTVAGRGAGPTRPQPTTYDQSGPTTLMKLADSHVFSPTVVADIYGSYMESPFRLIPEGGLNQQALYDANGIWQRTYGIYTYDTFQHQIHANTSVFLNTGKIAHELKFGFGYRHVTVDSYSAWPGDEIFGSEVSGLAAVTRAADLKYKVNFYNAYLSDTMTTGNLTVNVGVRYDYQEAANLPSNVAANPTFPNILPAVDYKGDAGYPVQWKDFQPRVSATYGIGDEKKTLARLSYARFADQLTNEIYHINAFPLTQYLYFYWNDANGDHVVQPGEVDTSPCVNTNCDPNALPNYSNIDPTNTGRSTSPNTISGHYRAPITDEFIVGLDHELMPNLAASVSYTYRHIKNLLTSQILGATAADYFLKTTETGSITGSDGLVLNYNIPVYSLPSSFGQGIEYLNQPNAYQTYQGIEFQLNKRLSDKWMFRGTFAYNDWKQHLPSGSILDPNNLRGGTTEDGALVVTQGSSGKSDVFINSKWQFNVTGLYQLPLGLNLGANIFGRQGFLVPYYIRFRANDPAVGTSRPRFQVGSVEDHRLNDVFEVDLRLEKTFPIGPVSLSTAIECFNVTNQNTVLQRSPDGTPALDGTLGTSFNTIEEVQSPRIFRASIRLSF